MGCTVGSWWFAQFFLYGNIAKRIVVKTSFMVSKMALPLAFSVLQSISFDDAGHSRESLS